MLTSLWKSYCAKVPQRWVFAVMGCMAMTNVFSMRICLSLAITEMVKVTETSSNVTVSDETCSASEPIAPNSHGGGTYDWDEYTQGLILSSFFGGYIITQIPGGILAQKFGGKHTLGLGVLSTSVFTLFTPLVVKAYDYTGLIALRFLMGIGEGTTLPAVGMLISQWAPPHERSKIGTTVISGVQLGTVVGTALSGVLINNSTTGWPIVFYFFGALGVLWFFAWLVLGYNNPDVHPFISESEKEYLNKTMNEHTQRTPQPIPWRHMATSIPLWVMLAATVCHCWGFSTMATDLPLYMKKILKFSVQANGLLSAAPYGVMWIVSIAGSWLADWLIKSEKLSRTNVRKVFTTASSIGPAIFIMAASFAGCDRTLVNILFNIGVGIMGLISSGLMMNIFDMSPNHSGTLMGIVNTIAALTAFMASYAVGVLTPNQMLMEWRIVFYITSVLFLMAATIFNVFGDSEVQYWNDMNVRVDQVEGKKRVDKVKVQREQMTSV